MWSPPEITLNKEMSSDAIRLALLLKNDAHNDVELWVDKLGFKLKIDDGFILTPPLRAVIYDNEIWIHRNLKFRERVEEIAHEYCHFKWHAACVQYRDTHPRSVARNEGQAIEFAKVVLMNL